MKFLIIEDSPLMAVVLQDLIDKFPYSGAKEAVVFANAEDALRYLQEIGTDTAALPNLVILDLELPGQHGLEFLKTFKNQELWKSIPVIINSTSKKKEDVLGAYKQGGLIFLRKENDPAAFTEVLHQLIVAGLLKAS